MDKKQHYVTNKELMKEIIEYKKQFNEYKRKKADDEDAEWPGVSEKLGLMIMKIAEGLAQKPQFIGYTFKHEFISDAVFNTLKYVKNFKPEEYNNPFAYITQICYNAFIAKIKKEQKHSKIKDICYNNYDASEMNFANAGFDYTSMKPPQKKKKKKKKKK